MTGEENAEEKGVPINAYIYNKKEQYEEIFRRTGHDEREDHVKDLIKRIQDNSKAILDRRKKIEGVGILYTHYGRFKEILDELFRLYELGFYSSTILLCGTLAERICYDLIDLMEITIDNKKLDQEKKKLLYKFNFRDLVDFLAGLDYINEKQFKLLNKIYDVRNEYVHLTKEGNAESDSIVTLNQACRLLEDLFSIFKFYNLKDGEFFVKDEYKDRIR